MKIGFIFLLKVLYYFGIYVLMRNLRDHITNKNSYELIDYWVVVYEMKIRKIFEQKSKKMFGE